MTLVHVTVPKGFELQNTEVSNLINAMHAKEAYIALGSLGTHFWSIPYFDSNNS